MNTNIIVEESYDALLGRLYPGTDEFEKTIFNITF
jgi:hypothetical protein